MDTGDIFCVIPWQTLCPFKNAYAILRKHNVGGNVPEWLVKYWLGEGFVTDDNKYISFFIHSVEE